MIRLTKKEISLIIGARKLAMNHVTDLNLSPIEKLVLETILHGTNFLLAKEKQHADSN